MVGSEQQKFKILNSISNQQALLLIGIVRLQTIKHSSWNILQKREINSPSTGKNQLCIIKKFTK